MNELTFERKDFYSPAEMSDIIDVHPMTVREWIGQGKLYGIKLSERITRIPLGALLEFLGQPLPVTREVMSQEEADDHWTQVSAEHESIPCGKRVTRF